MPEGMEGGEHETPAQQEQEDKRYEQLESLVAEQQQRIGELESEIANLRAASVPAPTELGGGEAGAGGGGEVPTVPPTTIPEETPPAARHPYFRRFGD